MADVVRFGLIGVGRWGKVYLKTLRSLSERCQITHLGTSKSENARLVPSPVKVHADWHSLIRSDCDAVIIATPPHTHAEMLEACLDAGKPCIVEKPLCLDVATAERLHRRVGESGVPVLVNHTRLFNPAYQALRLALGDSAESVRVLLSDNVQLGPFRTHTPTLWDWGPHEVSLCLDLIGESPITVGALGGPPDARGDPEAVSLRLEFAQGACAWIQVGRLFPQQRRTLSVLTDTRLYVLDDMVPNHVVVGRLDLPRRELGGVPETPELRPLPAASDRPPMETMLTYFADGLGGGDRRYFGTDLALDVVRVLAECEAAMKREGASSPARLSPGR